MEFYKFVDEDEFVEKSKYGGITVIAPMKVIGVRFITFAIMHGDKIIEEVSMPHTKPYIICELQTLERFDQEVYISSRQLIITDLDKWLPLVDQNHDCKYKLDNKEYYTNSKSPKLTLKDQEIITQLFNVYINTII